MIHSKIYGLVPIDLFTARFKDDLEKKNISIKLFPLKNIKFNQNIFHPASNFFFWEIWDKILCNCCFQSIWFTSSCTFIYLTHIRDMRFLKISLNEKKKEIFSPKIILVSCRDRQAGQEIFTKNFAAWRDEMLNERYMNISCKESSRYYFFCFSFFLFCLHIAFSFYLEICMSLLGQMSFLYQKHYFCLGIYIFFWQFTKSRTKACWK